MGKGNRWHTFSGEEGVGALEFWGRGEAGAQGHDDDDDDASRARLRGPVHCRLCGVQDSKVGGWGQRAGLICQLCGDRGSRWLGKIHDGPSAPSPCYVDEQKGAVLRDYERGLTPKTRFWSSGVRRRSLGEGRFGRQTSRDWRAGALSGRKASAALVSAVRVLSMGRVS